MQVPSQGAFSFACSVEGNHLVSRPVSHGEDQIFELLGMLIGQTGIHGVSADLVGESFGTEVLSFDTVALGVEVLEGNAG